MVPKKYLYALAVAATAVMLACGSSGTSSVDTGDSKAETGQGQQAAQGPATAKLGQGINVKYDDAETKITVKSIAKAKSDNMFDKAERGQFVAVDVDIFATKGETDLGPSNFRLVAKDGTVYQAEIMIAGIKPELDSMTTVKQGQRKTGKVVFDIDPEKFAGLKVELTDDSGDVQGYWTA